MEAARVGMGEKGLRHNRTAQIGYACLRSFMRPLILFPVRFEANHSCREDSNDLTLWSKPDTFVGNVAKKWLKDSPTLTQGNRADFCGIQLTALVPCYVLLCAVCCPREIGVPLTGWRIQRAQGESLAFRGVGPLLLGQERSNDSTMV